MSTPSGTSFRDMRFSLVTLPERARRRQVRFPRSKKSRIRKKFAKDPRNWVIEKETDWFVINQTLLQKMLSELIIPAPFLDERPIPLPQPNWRTRMEFAMPTMPAHNPYFVLRTS